MEVNVPWKWKSLKLLGGCEFGGIGAMASA